MKNIETVKGKNNRLFAVEPCLEPCPIERGMRVIGTKWTASVLWHIKDEPQRFNDLSRQLGGISKKVLSQRLKEMERNKLLSRMVLDTQPVSVSYAITDQGKSALSFLDGLKDWVLEHDI
jgi:DNA-binding HxlR family transcriptional regulator